MPELQRQGIGGLLSEAWEAETDLPVTFCDLRSIGVFRRKGMGGAAGRGEPRAFLRGLGRWEALDSDLDLSYP